MSSPIDLDSPVLADVDRRIGEADAERIVLEASSDPKPEEVERARAKLAQLHEERRHLLDQPANPEDLL